MIAIINTGDNPEATGLHTYRVQINQTLITTFIHRREAGLAECLRAAANAVDKYVEDNPEVSAMKVTKEPRRKIRQSQVDYWDSLYWEAISRTNDSI